MAFTPEQQLAINEEGQNIIVSAGAGSGKTAVLTERVIRKLKSGIDIDKLLILTFTNEAANEMKNRIMSAIIKNKLDNQLSLIDSAYIQTFDSFALSIVKKYNYVLNVSKDIKIIDTSIITMYKYKILDNIFETMYTKPKFDKLIDNYCLKDDKNMKDFIIELSNKLDLQVDKESYINNYVKTYFNEDNLDLLINNYEKLIIDKIKELKELLDDLSYYIDTKELEKLNIYLQILFNSKTYDELVPFKNKETIRINKVSEDGAEIKEELKNKIKEIKELLRYNNKLEIKEELIETKDNIETIIELVCILDKEVMEYKRQKQAYEFNDISHMAIDVVKNNENIRDELKKYFNEIMIDEYQDTSTIQETFINYISNNNVYMVGDIKQSIYRFRNANPYIFKEKYDKYSQKEDGIKIDLTKNFRSRYETIGNINEIFNNIMDNTIGNAEYLKDHNMIFGNEAYNYEDNKQNNKLEIYNYRIDEDIEYIKEEKELFIIAEDIKNKIDNNYQVLDKNTQKLRNITYSDICIITDRNKYIEKYRKILEYKGIPSVIYMDEELTNNEVIQVLKNLIALVNSVNNNNYDDKFKYYYTSVARSFIFNYKDNIIYENINSNNFTNDKIIELAKTINILEPIPSIINNILSTFNIYEKLITLTDIEKNLIRIDNLINISNNLSSLGYSIEDLIDYMNDVNKYGLEIKYSQSSLSTKAVKIMNIHKSKGLEFNLCYFTGMHNKFTIKEITSKFILSNKYGIIIPTIKDNELQNTILKDLYTNDYYIEEISEKIRLLYVALTRTREKMIIVTSLNDIDKGYSHLVPYNKRLHYRSFLDILNSISTIRKYIVNKKAEYSKSYDKIKISKILTNDSNIIIEKKKNDINYQLIDNHKYSKEQTGLINIEDISKMEYGTKIHEELEYADFKNPTNKYIKNLLQHIDKNYIKVYHEYEFMYTIEDILYNGVIDLMLEYPKEIKIIDYKLKNITDTEYLKQLSGYKQYIESISNKKVKTYLYSIIDDKLEEVPNEK